jgi:drug/metabolite transporter (DMT)-like permease
MLKIIALILFAELWGTAGQILYKKGVNSLDTPDLRDMWSYAGFLKGVLSSKTIWLGLVSITVGLTVWLVVLAQVDLSFAFPVDSMQYLITMIAASVFLGERIDRMKLLGTLLVIAGIIVVAKG